MPLVVFQRLEECEKKIIILKCKRSSSSGLKEVQKEPRELKFENDRSMTFFSFFFRLNDRYRKKKKKVGIVSKQRY